MNNPKEKPLITISISKDDARSALKVVRDALNRSWLVIFERETKSWTQAPEEMPVIRPNSYIASLERLARILENATEKK
jgi:hypothetical protein